jgi:DNA-binding GntR family transcriptional regulator
VTQPDAEFGGELLSATVKRLVLDRIVGGHYRPGERIVEFQLAKELGLSQSPVREGLRELAAVGIVTIHPRRGARVRLPSAKELADVSVVRAEVDALAARLASARVSETVLDELEALVREMSACVEAGDSAGLTEADVRFHHLIAEASENHALQRAFDQLAPFARTFITLTLPDVDVRAVVHEHRPILDGLRARDADRAADAAREHQHSVSALLLAHFPAGLGDPAEGEDGGPPA